MTTKARKGPPATTISHKDPKKNRKPWQLYGVIAKDFPEDQSGTESAPSEFRSRDMIKRICEHCQKTIEDEAYRVISEEGGVVLLNLIVCGACGLQAQALGLKTEAYSIGAGTLVLQ
jgi:hypothetical protein